MKKMPESGSENIGEDSSQKHEQHQIQMNMASAFAAAACSIRIPDLLTNRARRNMKQSVIQVNRCSGVNIRNGHEAG